MFLRAAQVALCGCVLAGGCTAIGPERVILFPTAAHLDEKQEHWVVPVEGWVFQPLRGLPLRNWGFKWMMKGLGLTDPQHEEARRIFDTRVDSFIADGRRGRILQVHIGAKTQISPPTDAAGRFAFEVKLDTSDAMELADDGRLRYSVQLLGWSVPGDHGGVAYMIGPTGVSVISDIDDTIKISEVLVKGEMIRNMFIREFRAVPGMAEAYQRWAGEGAVFHYVSASPTQLYMALAEFVRSERFPDAVFSLKRIGWFDSFMSNIWKSSTETKPPIIERIIEAFPGRRFILVGDSGEHDPEIYGQVARQHPKSVLHIYIRDVTGEHVLGSRYRKAFADLPEELWTVFTDPSELLPIESLEQSADPAHAAR